MDDIVPVGLFLSMAAQTVHHGGEGRQNGYIMILPGNRGKQRVSRGSSRKSVERESEESVERS